MNFNQLGLVHKVDLGYLVFFLHNLCESVEAISDMELSYLVFLVPFIHLEYEPCQSQNWQVCSLNIEVYITSQKDYI